MFGEFGRVAVTRCRIKSRVSRTKDLSAIRFAQSCCRLDQRIEHRLQIESRATDDLEHVGGGALLLQRFAQLVEQTRVLDGDDSLIREVLDQLDLLVGERMTSCR